MPFLLTDGTVLVHVAETRKFYKLTPDANGDYRNGTWSQMGSLPTGYGPLYYASSVLADGRVVVIGGEYNLSGGGTWTNLGAIYNPVTNVWASLSAPPGWANVGDAQCTVMPDGKFLMAMPFDKRIALLDPATLTWTNLASTAKTDRHDEEGWNLLPDGTILTVNAINAPACERYIPTLDRWISAGSTPQSLCDPGSQEIGPMVVLPNGKVFATGATGHNAVYTRGATLMDAGSWVSAPDFPNIGGQLDIADGPACLLPNGNVLCDTSPGVFNSPSHFFEYNGTAMLTVPDVPNSASNSSFVGNMLMLPTGQVLFTDFSKDVEIYTPVGGPQDAWRPTISNAPSNINQAMSFTLTGTQLNGLSQCTAYGDDSTNFTNYPLVRFKNIATGHIKYARTHDHSTMAIATGSTPVTTQVDVPASTEIGPSTMEVVTNGIPSAVMAVNIVAPGVVLPSSYQLFRGSDPTGTLQNLYFVDSNALRVQPGPVATGAEAPIQLQITGSSPIVSPTSLQLTTTVKGSTPNLGLQLYLFNWTTLSFEAVDSRALTTGYQTVTIAASGNLARFVDPINRTVRASLNVKQTGPIATYPYSVDVDTFYWIIS